MKAALQRFLQTILGFENYLYFLSIFKVFTSKYNKWEKDFHHFLTLISNGQTVLDIGANVGVMTVLIAKKIRTGHVYSFEPVQLNYTALCRVISRFGLKNVTPFNFALGNEAKYAKMFMPILKSVKMTGYSYIADNSAEQHDNMEFSVEVRVLDKEEEFRGKKIHAMKIDVEGYERFVLEGSLELIRENKPIIYCELADSENRKKSMELLKSLDYKVFVYENKKLIQYEPERHHSVNYFFLPE